MEAKIPRMHRKKISWWDGTVDLRAPGYQDTAATNKILLVTPAGE